MNKQTITEKQTEIKICLLCKKEAETTVEVVKNRYEIDVCKEDMDFINRNLDTIEKLYTAVSPEDERSIVL